MIKLVDSLEHPIRQSIVLLIVCLVGQLAVLVFHQSEGAPHLFHWVISMSVLLLFAFFNSVYLLKTKDARLYIRNSIYAFVILLVSTFGMAVGFSEEMSSNQMSVRWIFFTIIFSYFIFLTIAYFMRKIIEYAQRQDTESKS
ncbi:MAG: hypothetical protein IPL46_06760 [Saprospiraceae bacterium]|nr:hypothetical protein [Saprospiraceae bacterium]